MRKRILNGIISIVAIGLIGVIAVNFYVIHIGGKIHSKADLQNLISEIQRTDALPVQFYELYETKFIRRIDYGARKNAIYYLFTNNYSQSPSLLVAKMSAHSHNKFADTRRSKLANYGLAIKLEQEVSQKECIKWLAENYDFMNGQTGISAASKYYFQKEVEELNKEELAMFIIMFENSALYNPRRNPEGVNKRVQELLIKVDQEQ